MKPTIYATGNETLKGEFNISYYVLEKEEKFFDWLSKLLIEVLEIKNGDSQARFIVRRLHDEEGYEVGEEIYIKEIKKMVDIHEKYSQDKNRVNVFYGKKRVYVSVKSSREFRKKFVHFVEKTRDWIKVEEKAEEKIPVYAKKHKSVKYTPNK